MIEDNYLTFGLNMAEGDATGGVGRFLVFHRKGGHIKPVKDVSYPLQPGESNVLHGSGVCKWFNVRMGFGFLTMTKKEGVDLQTAVDVFVHQLINTKLDYARTILEIVDTSANTRLKVNIFLSKLHMEGFRSLKEGECVEFTFKRSSKGLESTRVTGPGGAPCIGSERRPKIKGQQKRNPKGDRCYNCGGLDHHAKECNLPPQPKKCHFCQSTSHMVAQCSVKAAQPASLQEKPTIDE